jgi:hypothetical protein
MHPTDCSNFPVAGECIRPTAPIFRWQENASERLLQFSDGRRMHPTASSNFPVTGECIRPTAPIFRWQENASDRLLQFSVGRRMHPTDCSNFPVAGECIQPTAPIFRWQENASDRLLQFSGSRKMHPTDCSNFPVTGECIRAPAAIFRWLIGNKGEEWCRGRGMPQRRCESSRTESTRLGEALSRSSRKMSRFSIPPSITCCRIPSTSIRAGILQGYCIPRETQETQERLLFPLLFVARLHGKGPLPLRGLTPRGQEVAPGSGFYDSGRRSGYSTRSCGRV